MPDMTKSRRTAKLAAKFLTLVGQESRYLAHPCDEHGVLLPEQPSSEESDAREAFAAECDQWAEFELELAKRLPAVDDGQDDDEVVETIVRGLAALNAASGAPAEAPVAEAAGEAEPKTW